ncbi:MAG: PAS domain S-box protein [Verrucomicrobiota bacterium]
MNLRNVPIKRKLTIVIMLTSSVVLLLTSGAFIIYELVAFRSTLLENSQTLAQIVAATSTAALTFDDEKAAAEILSKLQAEDTILQASLYNIQNNLMARYPASQPLENFPAVAQGDGHYFEHRTLNFFVPVSEGDSRIGTLYLKTDLKPIYHRLRLYGGIMAGVLVGSLLIGLALSNWLQKRISEPILELAETAKAVSIKRDYLVRARKFGSDELGLLTDAFNHMLTQIHERDVALTESEGRARAVLNAAVSAVVVIDARGRILDWNVRAEQLFGWTRQEAIGQILADTIIPPRYREAHQRGISQFLVTGKGPVLNRLIELSALRRDNTEFPVELSISPMKTGDVTTFCGFITDITERKEAAEALSLLAAIVESSDDAIVGKDLSGTIVSWNAGAEKMFGYSAKEAIGRKSSFIIPPDRLNEEVLTLVRIQQGRIEHYQTTRLRKDGSTFHVSLTMSPIKDAEGTIIGASASARDVSDRIRAEEEIRALNTQLEERVLLRTAELAETNKELEAFTYTVSHDLRAPLRHIDGFAQILEEELQKNMSTQVRKFINRIRQGVQNMGKLVDDLLNLSKAGRQEVTREAVPLNLLVDEVLSDLKPELKQRSIQWQIGQLPTAQCDRGLIKQVFANLISNAIKYTRPREKAVIEIGTEKNEGETAIFVRDNGVGFNMQYAHKLFGVFQRLHRTEEFEGTGVGLATVQRIIQLHGGHIWAQAELDKGATFYFTLKGIERA